MDLIEKDQNIADDGEEVTLEGVISYVTYQNNANGYTVCELETDDEDITMVGIMPGVMAGESIRVLGKWVTHPTYGPQFQVNFYEKQLPATAESMIKYLSSGAIKGIGKKTAAKIVAMFGGDTFDVLEHHPEYLTDIPGINPKKAKEITEQFQSQFGIRNVMIFCREFFGPATSVKIYKRFGSGAVDIIKQNPYILCKEIRDIGFERADNFAKSLGYEMNSPERIMAGVRHALLSNSLQNGHTFLPKERLIDLTAKILDVEKILVESLFENEIEGIHIEKIGTTECVYLNEYFEAESFIIKKLLLMDKVYRREGIEDIDKLVSQIEFEENIEYATSQKKAIFTALTNGIMILTGGPGTGKTTIIRAIILIARRMGYNVALAAPTGRAAKRMSEATSCEAKTIHRLLEMKYGGEELKFSRDENNLLEGDFFIVDEASMIDTLLLASLLRAVKPGSRLLLIGDSDQLPSVGAGNVLCDLIACDKFATVRLTEIFRQASESRIVTNAHAINDGELPVLDDKNGDFFFITRDESKIPDTIADLCLNRLPRTYGKDITREIQIITPSHKGTAGTEVLNKLLQSVENPPMQGKKERKFRDVVFREGDKVMQIRNNYDIEWTRGNEEGIGIFNGDIGRIIKIDHKAETLTIQFDDRIAEYTYDLLEELEHAYAITVHKSQGSEYPVVIIPMFNYSPRLLTRNLLYTAVTRAQKMVIMVGRPEIVQGMVENRCTVNRYTGIRYLINKYESD